MPTGSQQTVAVRCPACGTQYTAQVQNVIDVGREPRLKELFLQGRLNVGVCPGCGTGGMLALPVVYHDPDKELLFCLIPQEMQLNESERQRIIGEMSNAIINSLPPEKRKGYLLQPRIFLTYSTMAEAILEADGITKEMLQAQQEKARLLTEMAQAVDDPIRLGAIINQHQDSIDEEFFSLLAANLQVALQNRQEGLAQALARLRDRLLAQTPAGRELAEVQKAIEKALEGLDENLTRDDLLERIIAIEEKHQDQVLGILIAVTRPLLDYVFFQMLAGRIKEAEKEGNSQLAERLRSLRTKLLDLTQRLDAEARARVRERTRLLEDLLQAADIEAAVRDHIHDIDPTLMQILDGYIAESTRTQQRELAEQLLALREHILHVLHESAPPEVQFINRLLQADYPDETRKILQENRATITGEWLSMVNELARDLDERGDKTTSERLRGILAQAQLMV